MKYRTNEEAMIEMFREDPSYPIAMLNDIFADGDDQGELLILLRYMAKARGTVQEVAEDASLNPTQLYRTLSPKGNPELRSLVAILKALGLRLQVKRIAPAKKTKASPRKKPAKSPASAKTAKAA